MEEEKEEMELSPLYHQYFQLIRKNQQDLQIQQKLDKLNQVISEKLQKVPSKNDVNKNNSRIKGKTHYLHYLLKL